MPGTIVEVLYPGAAGRIALRGSHEPLSWERDVAPETVDKGLHTFRFDLPRGTLLEFKAVRDDGLWSRGRNETVLAGETTRIHPYFERGEGLVESELRHLDSPELGRPLSFRVFLPPSYGEHVEQRYPVLYAQDGQSLFSDYPDPFDGQSWHLDQTLNELYDLGVIDEVIVIAISTDRDRTDLLSPTRDARYGGGRGPAYRDFLEHTLKPYVDATFRTLTEPRHTALMGSSMGGLFAFFAAWTRSSVFGRAACLSGSFWWNDRALIHSVQGGACPLPRPWLYLDSGAARNAFEEDVNVRDGRHHTAALHAALVGHCYVGGDNLHAFAFTGLSHDNASWAARVAIPLQLLFPRGA